MTLVKMIRQGAIMHSHARILLICLPLLFVSGCGKHELYSGLSEPQANEMVALLYGAGMPADKSREAGGQFTVLTDKSSFAAAVNLLHANGLPSASYENLGQVFAKEGFVSSPLEERARLNHAMSQEIAHTISSIDGVLLARVHLAVPEQNELSDTKKQASASVFIKHRVDVDLTGSVSQIKALVVNGIEQLPYDNVTVALFKAEPPVATGALKQQGVYHASLPLTMATTLRGNSLGLWMTFSGLAILGILSVFWWKFSAYRVVNARTRAGGSAAQRVSKPADHIGSGDDVSHG